MKTIRRSQPDDLKAYIAANYNVGLRHYKRAFSMDTRDIEAVFYMFVFCLLVPGGKATQTRKAVCLLQDFHFYDKECTREAALTLIKSYVRFPEQKVDRLMEFKVMWPAFSQWLFKAIEYRIPAVKVRENIVKNVKGFGFKAASHALRNLGYTNLAVIDTHILKYAKYWYPEKPDVGYPTSESGYLKMEESFRHWAQERFNLDPCVLDWFIWCKESGNAINAMDC